MLNFKSNCGKTRRTTEAVGNFMVWFAHNREMSFWFEWACKSKIWFIAIACSALKSHGSSNHAIQHLNLHLPPLTQYTSRSWTHCHFIFKHTTSPLHANNAQPILCISHRVELASHRPQMNAISNNEICLKFVWGLWSSTSSQWGSDRMFEESSQQLKIWMRWFMKTFEIRENVS